MRSTSLMRFAGTEPSASHLYTALGLMPNSQASLYGVMFLLRESRQNFVGVFMLRMISTYSGYCQLSGIVNFLLTTS